MDHLSANRWSLTPKALHGLLERLDGDPERAGWEYERLRRKLVDFFSIRGVVAAEALADETLDRLSQKIERDAEISNPRAYAYGIARWVLLEWERRHIQ